MSCLINLCWSQGHEYVLLYVLLEWLFYLIHIGPESVWNRFLSTMYNGVKVYFPLICMCSWSGDFSWKKILSWLYCFVNTVELLSNIRRLYKWILSSMSIISNCLYICQNNVSLIIEALWCLNIWHYKPCHFAFCCSSGVFPVLGPCHFYKESCILIRICWIWEEMKFYIKTPVHTVMHPFLYLSVLKFLKPWFYFSM